MEALVEETGFERYSAYKASGVEWLGEVPVGWHVKKLKHILKFLTGGTPSSHNNNYYDGYEPWATIADMHGKFIEKTHFISKSGVRAANIPLTMPGSLLYSFKLTVGQVAFTRKKLYTNEAIASFGPQSGVNLNYWYYSLPLFIIKNANTNIYGAYLLNQDLIKNSTLVYPPLNEQTAISNFLDRKIELIDQTIAQKEKQIKLLAEHEQILINKYLTQGINSNIPMQNYPMEWIEKIPAHWEIKRVKNIFQLIIEPASKNNNHELLSVYTDIGVKPRKELPEKGNKASTTDGYLKVKKGDIIVNKLLAWMGAIGLSYYDGVTSPAYDVLRPRIKIENEYYNLLFRSKSCCEELKKHSRGIMDMRLRLYFDKFGVIEVPYPPIEEQIAIVSFIENTTSKVATAISCKQNEIEKLREYKAILINSAVTGKIKVS